MDHGRSRGAGLNVTDSIQKTFIDPQKGNSFAALPATTGAPQHKISHVKNPNRYPTTKKGRWMQGKVK